ncbi:MAG TPA: hypothetical protein VKR06_36495 [Ktedonosporobacter sp.]|nr:hypothetical protein [Ktedonosporobacter sp.]
MILSGAEIKQAVQAGLVVIDPFSENCVNPNSYNYHLGRTLKVLDEPMLEPLDDPPYREITIPPDGIVLRPERLYLGHTLERIGSEYYVPSLIGRSSMGRLGVFLQVSADLGNLGAIHRWTLEIVVSQPIRLYRDMVVGQVSFWVPTGEKLSYNGYLGQFSEPKESPSWLLGVSKEVDDDFDRS